MSGAEAGKVYLVGAGPGDPELLTLRAARLLGCADVVLHDDLVPQAILDLAGNRALVVSVGKRCRGKKISQNGIHELMITSARRDLVVVRLKSGDPTIFGRAGEEIDALRSAGVPFEIVPGITAASAAAGFLGISLTDRRGASRLIVLSGHRAAGSSPESPQEFLCSPGEPEAATLAIYMPGSTLKQAVGSLLRSGVSGSMPCVAVSDATRPEAEYRVFRLEDFEEMPAIAGPRLLLVGRTLAPLLEIQSGEMQSGEAQPEDDATARDSIASLLALVSAG